MNTDQTHRGSVPTTRRGSRARKIAAVAGLTATLGFLGAGAAMAQPNNGGTSTPKNCTLGGKTYSPGSIVTNPKLKKSWICSTAGTWVVLAFVAVDAAVTVDPTQPSTGVVPTS